jgi:phage shock protein C
MATEYRRFYRSRDGRMIGGVCAGLGDFFGIDPTLVRLFFVFGSLLGWAGALVLGYLIMLIVVPEEPVLEVSSPTPVE